MRHNSSMLIADTLTEWFVQHARTLPWRTEPRDAYWTLVSEIMLQQTQMDRVVPKFVKFVERFPDLQALASATEDDVLAMWSGLGYYRRARLLHRLARQVDATGANELPGTFEALLTLPGVGDYTAAAVGSLAFGLKEPVLDGNVRRVVARMTAFDGDTRASRAEMEMKSWVRDLFRNHAAGVINEALMELGATVCSPAGPSCSTCPLAPWCAGYQAGCPENYPQPRKVRPIENLRWVAACLVMPDGRWLLRKIETGPILRGLWLPPVANLEGDADALDLATGSLPEGFSSATGTVLDSVRHHITHRRIEVIPVLFRISPEQSVALCDELTSFSGGRYSGDTWQCACPGEVKGGTSSLFEKLHKAIECKE